MKNELDDRSFDDIAVKFQKNIYGSTKGQLRHELLLNYLTEITPITGAALDVLDAGGGTGMMTEAMLKLGHKVKLTDISDETLTFANQQLSHYDNLTTEQTDILSLDESTQYDLVICHAVLEWVKDPQQVIAKLNRLVKPQGHLSLSFFNRDAQLFGNICYGNFDYVEKGLKVKNRVRLTPNNPLAPQDVLKEFEALPLSIVHKAGIRCFHDYLRNLEHQQTQYHKLKKVELEYGRQAPYLWLGKYFHIIAKSTQ